VPNVSQAQRAAMAAAASGRSDLGIPPSVGREFMSADQGGKLPPRAPKKKPAASARLYRGAKGVGRGAA